MKKLFQLTVLRSPTKTYYAETYTSKVKAVAQVCTAMTPVTAYEYVTLRNSLIEWMRIEDKTLTIKMKL